MFSTLAYNIMKLVALLTAQTAFIMKLLTNSKDMYDEEKNKTMFVMKLNNLLLL